jgi:hypothetical protein
MLQIEAKEDDIFYKKTLLLLQIATNSLLIF